MKFELADDKRKAKEQNDEPGIIIIKIWLSEKGHCYAKGNIQRTIRLKNCRVSDVHNALLEFITKGQK